MTLSPGARTSGTAEPLGGFELGLWLARIQPQLKQAPDVLAAESRLGAAGTRNESDNGDALFVDAVAPRVALSFVQRTQPHERDRKLRTGR